MLPVPFPPSPLRRSLIAKPEAAFRKENTDPWLCYHAKKQILFSDISWIVGSACVYERTYILTILKLYMVDKTLQFRYSHDWKS